jgi:hypothetical protein
LSNTFPVHSGSNSISATASTWQALSFWHADLNAAAYTNLSFWINGGAAGGQKLQVYAQYGTNSGATVQLPALPANTWQWMQVSLVKLAVANATNLNRITLQLTASGASGTFYVDDMELSALHGQAGVQYVIQTATDLGSWKSVSTNTNTLSADSFTFGYSLAPGPRYWRALWQP